MNRSRRVTFLASLGVFIFIVRKCLKRSSFKGPAPLARKSLGTEEARRVDDHMN